MKGRLILLPIVIVLMSVVFTIGEARYMLWGRVVDASVRSIELKEKRRKYGQREMVKHVTYSFQDDTGRSITETDKVDPRWPVSEPTTQIECVGGVFPTSRLVGNDHKNWMWLSGSLAVVGAGVLGWMIAGKLRGAR